MGHLLFRTLDGQQVNSDRFFDHVQQSSGCWIWSGATRSGYGMFRVGTKIMSSHVVSYLLKFGHISKGMQLDHLCRNTLCCNPSHLEPVTPKENALRGLTGKINNHGSGSHVDCPRCQ